MPDNATIDAPVQLERPPVGTPRKQSRVSRVLLPLGVAAAIIGVWQLACMVFGIPVYIIPSPVNVWDSLTTNWSMLLANTWPTAMESALGFLLGNVVAILLAVLFVHWKSAERAL